MMDMPNMPLRISLMGCGRGRVTLTAELYAMCASCSGTIADISLSSTSHRKADQVVARVLPARDGRAHSSKLDPC